MKERNYQASINKIRAGVGTVDDILDMQYLIENSLTREEVEYMLDAIIDKLDSTKNTKDVMAYVLSMKEHLHVA